MSVVHLTDAPLLKSKDGAQHYRNTIPFEGLGEGLLEAGWYGLLPGTRNQDDIHPHNDEYYFIKEGSATLYLDGIAMPISEGDSIKVPKGTSHYIVNTGDIMLEFFYLYVPPLVRDPDAPKVYFPVDE